MFIKTSQFTINTEQILWAEFNANETTTIYFSNGKELTINSEQEARELWGMIGRQTLPSVFRRESQGE